MENFLSISELKVIGVQVEESFNEKVSANVDERLSRGARQTFHHKRLRRDRAESSDKPVIVSNPHEKTANSNFECTAIHFNLFPRLDARPV